MFEVNVIHCSLFELESFSHGLWWLPDLNIIISPKFLKSRRALEFKEVMAACKRCSRSARSLVERTWRSSWWSHREFSLSKMSQPVGGWYSLPYWKRLMFVNWDDDIPNWMENKIHVPNHQPVTLFGSHQMISDDRRCDVTKNIFDSDGNIGWNICFDRDVIEMHLCTSCMCLGEKIFFSYGNRSIIRNPSIGHHIFPIFPMAMVTKNPEWFVVCWRQKPGMWFITTLS